MTLRPKTRNLQHLDHLHPVLFANEQIILRKNVGSVPRHLIQRNGSNKAIQRTVVMKGKDREFWPIQDLYQFPKDLSIRKATAPMGWLHISEIIRFIWPTHYSIPLSSNFEHPRSMSCLAATNGERLHSKI